MKEYIQIIYKQEIQRMKAEILREPCDGSGGEFTRDLSINFDKSTTGRGDRDLANGNQEKTTFISTSWTSWRK